MTRSPLLSRLLLLLSVAVWVVAFPHLAVAQGGDTGSIAGQITIARSGFPDERVLVTLETRGAMVGQAWTDNEGRFGFYQLPANLYHVVVDDEKYQYYEERVHLDLQLSQTAILNIQLTPKPRAGPPVAQPVVPGGNPYLVDPAEYRKQFPKNVVKEFERGVKYQNDGQADEAIRHFREALKLAPDFYAAHNNLGAIYLSRRDFPAAQAEFEAVLKLNQSDSQACFNLGNVFLLTRRYGEAEPILEEGLRRQPNAALGHLLLGTVLARTNRLQEAERELRKAQELDSLLSQAPLELVNLYLPQHRLAEAIGELKLFLKLFPADPLAPKARDVLARLESSAKPDSQTH